jgi:taurine dioxygenase
VLIDGEPVGPQDVGRYWHSDLCYLQKPPEPLFSTLWKCRSATASRLAALFARTGTAYEDLPFEVKCRVEGLVAINSYNAMYDRKASEFGVRPGLTDDKRKNKYPKDAMHPVVRTHPITGRKCIYVCEAYTKWIVNIPEEESRELLDLLFAQRTKPQYVYRRPYMAHQPGDNVLRASGGKADNQAHRPRRIGLRPWDARSG